MKNIWWKEAVIYQIYPRSFQDSNGDGIGDLEGIIQRLDYLMNLGISVIWLNPCYSSPNDDNGYDISDYKNIMAEFGNMDDFDRLLQNSHARGIKIIMDLVVNHSSDEHPWFIESRSSKENRYRDYYIWRTPKEGREPNNWGSFFSPSAWEYDKTTGEYYLHLFSKKQPDLNWNCSILRREIYDMMNFWLEKRIDGFRMDVINFLQKPKGLPDSKLPSTRLGGYCFDPTLYTNNPGMVEILQEMYQMTLSEHDVMTVGETLEVTPSIAFPYVQESNNTLNMIFHFEHLSKNGGWSLPDFKTVQKDWYEGVWDKGGWLSQYLGNHDQPRSVSTYGNDSKAYRGVSAKLLATMLHTLPGTPYIFQGEEIGMTNYPFSSISEFKDINAHFMYKEMIETGKTPIEALTMLNKVSREHSRTPMQWEPDSGAGFTTGIPWLRINPNHREINVSSALADKNSILFYYKELISLRKYNQVMIYGDYHEVNTGDPDVYAYTRSDKINVWLVVLLFSRRGRDVTIPKQDVVLSGGNIIICNYGENFGRSVEMQQKQTLALSSYEAMVIDVSKTIIGEQVNRGVTEF